MRTDGKWRGRSVARLCFALALAAPASVAAQEGGSGLDAPADGSSAAAEPRSDDGARGTPVHITSELLSDRVRAHAVDVADATDPPRCRVPCALDLMPGRWQLRFSSGFDTTLDVGVTTLLVKARPMDGTELGIGIGAVVIGLVALGAVGLLALDGMGWSFDGMGSLDYGPLVLGVGVMTVAIGIGLSVDSAASLEVIALPGLRRRSED